MDDVRRQGTGIFEDRLLLRVPEACQLTGLSRSLGYQLVRSGEWPSVRVGCRALRIPREGLMAWIEQLPSD